MNKLIIDNENRKHSTDNLKVLEQIHSYYRNDNYDSTTEISKILRGRYSGGVLQSSLQESPLL